IAHIAEHHHGIRVEDGPIKPVIFIGGWNGEDLGPNALAAHWRPLELKADETAARIMARAGFDPLALLEYGRRTPSSNDDASRVDHLIQSIQELPRQDSILSSTEFSRVQEELRGLAPRDPFRLARPPSLHRTNE